MRFTRTAGKRVNAIRIYSTKKNAAMEPKRSKDSHEWLAQVVTNWAHIIFGLLYVISIR